MTRNELIYPYIGSICRYMHVQYTLVKWDSEGTKSEILFPKHFLSHLAIIQFFVRLSKGISMSFAFRGPIKSVPFSECLIGI